MNILLLTIGSSGDVHPFVGLGLALRRRGHEVKLVTSPHFGGAAVRAGLDLVPLGTADDMRAALANPDVWSARRGHKAIFDIVLNGLRQTYDAVTANLTPDTVVVASSLGFAARVAQDKLGFRMATVHLSPAQFRSSLAPPKLPGLFMPDWFPLRLKQKIWEGGDRFYLDRLLGPALNRFRAEVGLPPASAILNTWWNSPDRVIGLFPDWFAPPQADWWPQSRLTGFPLYDEADTHAADPALDAFLAAGDRPVAFTPGTAMHHAHAFFRAAVETCRRLGRRGLLLTRHAEQVPANLPETVRHVPYAPFSSLLPRVAAVVHHGGIGTTAQALAAGVPQLVTPFAHDQFDNADRLRRLGVGRTVRASRLTARRAARGLSSLLGDSDVRTACDALAERVRAGQPLDRTCQLIEALARPAGAATNGRTEASGARPSESRPG